MILPHVDHLGICRDKNANASDSEKLRTYEQ